MNTNEVEKLVQDTKSGNADAFGELYQATSQRIYFTCLSLLKSEQDARDAMQDTYLTAYKNLGQLSQNSKFNSWLERIAVNRCKDILKKRIPTPTDESEINEMLYTEDEIYLPEEFITNKEKRIIIMNIMRNELSELQYQTVTLYYFNNLTISEIAEILDCEENAVKNRLYVARGKIRKGIDKYEKDNDDKLHAFVGLPFLSRVLSEECKAQNAPIRYTDIRTKLDSQQPNFSGKAAASKGVYLGSITICWKLVVSVIVAVILVGAVTTAWIINKSSQSTSKDDSQTKSSVTTPKTDTNKEATTDFLFSLTPHILFKDKQGMVEQMGGSSYAGEDYFVLNDNTVWHKRIGESEYKQFSTFDNRNDTLVTKTVYGISEADHVMTVMTDDGKTTIYSNERTAVIPATDFSMLNSDIALGIFNTYQIRDGKLTVTIYDANGKVLSDNHELSFYSLNMGYIPAEDIKDVYVYYDSFGVLKNDGTMYFLTSLPLFKNGEAEFTLTISQYFDILNNVYTAVSTDDSSVIFYSVLNDEHYIYYAETSFATENYMGKCSLPDGYEPSDIDKVSCQSDIYMFMNDGTVFYAPEINENPSWTVVDILTEINKNGELKAFRNLGMQKNVLKSDGTIYILTVTES